MSVEPPPPSFYFCILCIDVCIIGAVEYIANILKLCLWIFVHLLKLNTICFHSLAIFKKKPECSLRKAVHDGIGFAKLAVEMTVEFILGMMCGGRMLL